MDGRAPGPPADRCERVTLVLAVRPLTFIEAGRVEWQEVPDATVPGPAGAVVRPLAVARCDLDLPMAMGSLFPGPFALGHETVAEVADIGDQVQGRRPGDRVLVPFQVSCGACAACTGGRFALPDNVADGFRAVGPAQRERPGAEVLVVGGMVKSVALYAVAAAVAGGAAWLEPATKLVLVR